MKYIRVYSDSQVEVERKVFEAMRNGMSYLEATDKFAEPYWDAISVKFMEDFENDKYLTESIVPKERRRRYEVDNVNLTITEVVE